MSRKKGQKKMPASMTKPEALEVDEPIIVTDAAEVVVPCLDLPGAVVQHRFEGLRFTRRQAKALRCVFDGLQAEGEEVQLELKRPVRHIPDALRYLLDAIADAMEVE